MKDGLRERLDCKVTTSSNEGTWVLVYTCQGHIHCTCNRSICWTKVASGRQHTESAMWSIAFRNERLGKFGMDPLHVRGYQLGGSPAERRSPGLRSAVIAPIESVRSLTRQTYARLLPTNGNYGGTIGRIVYVG